ncbi:MAG: hypothetical protein DDT21_02019 [Syntrophomonadaceae bacterium]|nr:hypothetical protein [Bacillota bacterium]
MSQPELLKIVIQVLVQSGIRYMITGSVVSSLQGEPRSTHDLDIVVAIHGPDVKKLLAAFPPPDYYLDKDSIIAAIDRGSMFNLIDVLS